jgi:hypothetical protein
LSGMLLPLFQRNSLTTFSRYKLVYHEGEDSIFIQNIDSHLPDYAMSYYEI